MIVCYLVSVVVLWIFHKAPKWISSTYSEDITGDDWPDRVARWLALRKHEPSLLVDVLSAAIPFALIYVSTSLNVSPNSDWDRDDLVIAGFVCIGFSLLVIFGLGANIAINPQWSRSYPLIAIYFASITIVFAKLYVLLGMVDGDRSSADYYTGLYLSLITIANLGSGDVVPSVESRFVAVTESLIGYVALAFLAALLFTTMQRGMRSQIKAYNRRRRAVANAILPSSTSRS
jgi:hypothetical protein